MYKLLISTFLLTTIIVNAQNDFNKLDENGQKDGLWKGFFAESKRLRYQGTFEHGVEVGTFNFYDDTKAADIIGTRVFNPKNNSVYTTFFDQKKNIVSEGNAINKKNEGVWKYYHQESKVVMTLENYKDGKLNGKRTVYYPSGQIAEEINYINGVKEGEYKKITEKNIILETAIYKNDQLNGKATYRETDNQLVSEGLYSDGKKVGIWKFYSNGKVSKQINFNKQGKKFEKKKTVKPLD